MEGNSVGKGFGATIGVLLALSLLALIPICGCGGCLMVGLVAGPGLEPARRAAEKIEQRRMEQEAEPAKPIKLDE